ncbi:MAG TPA: amidohydrolase family protein [Candidatus Binataceae bacterium]|nr:amidohydrolase family protein [Candidatus Binataceae bacterium]
MSLNAAPSKSAAIRAKLSHPIIDSDGHTVEFEPALQDYIGQVGGSKMPDRYAAAMRDGAFGWYAMTPKGRRDHRMIRPPWWGLPTKNTLDRATASVPKLLYERMGDFGLDFTVLYPTVGLFVTSIADDEVRRAATRALNIFHAELFAEYRDRMTPAAVIPMRTPQEAIEEMEFAVRKLGMKVVMMDSHVQRPLAAAAKLPSELAGYARWFDNLVIDSEYDYDPVWAKCVELKVSPSFHSAGMGWGSRTTTTNYMYNHIGHFAAAGEALCKALFMGGVTRRFPTLRFAFLECGVAWACGLYSDMIGHWDKRNAKAIDNYNPAHLDRELLLSLLERYGGKLVEGGRLDRFAKSGGIFTGNAEDGTSLDDWAACGIEKKSDIKDLFAAPFYFGCEADDPCNAWAFNAKTNPFKARLNAVFSSDIGHWDVPDMTEVAEEAYELVEHGLITPDDFRDFVFTNPVGLWASTNPDFFKGTAVEADVNKLLMPNRVPR